MRKINYNPDVLSCLANLSNDEVFTSPNLTSEMLDILPPELFTNKNTTFLDPVSKSGIFLREIARRLMDGLEKEIPDKEERINHIFENQIFGIAITELTALLSRRSVYCSKTANGKYSICETFTDKSGNIKFDYTEHTWEKGRCKYCGASEDVYNRDKELETHAYQFIHTDNPKKIFNMKFDVIIGNPPYHLSDGGGMKTGSSSGSSIPLYDKFVEQAKKLNPKYLIMIIPARWYSGGRGLNQFRKDMLNDKRIKVLIDFVDSKDCFPGVDIAGGVCYFLWDNNYNGLCNYKTKSKTDIDSRERDLNEFEVFIRENISLDIIHKVIIHETSFMSDVVYSSNPFGFRSYYKGATNKNKLNNSVSILTSRGINYVERNKVLKNTDLIDKWKVVLSKASAEHAGQTDRNGQKKVFSKIEVLEPGEICSESYLLMNTFDSELQAKNLKLYISSSFFRFLVSTILITQNIAKDKFQFVPNQNFSETWIDENLIC